MMRKSLFVLAALLCLTLLCAVPGALAAVGEDIGSEEEFVEAISYYREHGAEEFSVTLVVGYLKTLEADNFRELVVIGMKAGLTNYRMSYNDFGLMQFESLEWEAEPHVADCATEQDVRRAVERFLEEGAETFQLIIRDERLYETLQDGQRINAYAGMYGVKYMNTGHNSQAPYVIFIKDIEMISEPWYAVYSPDDWIRAIETMAARKTTRFTLVVDPFFADRIEANPDMIKQLMARSPLEMQTLSYYGNCTRFFFENVVYNHKPRIECETEEAVVETIRQMGASGITAFRLILSEELYDALSPNNFRRLQKLEAQAGMSKKNMSYIEDMYTVVYSDAVIRSDAAKLETAQEVQDFLAKAVADGEEDIALFCTPELYDLLTGDPAQNNGRSAVPAEDALSHAGIFHYRYIPSEASKIITVDVEALYPGTKILCAVEKDDLSALAEREAETLAAARQLAEACRGGDDTETAWKIHDALCERIVYTDDESTDEDDTAVGALLNGQANCDGYADAFYLTGTLAGLKVRYQRGDSISQDPDDPDRDVSHMWNLVEIDGTWRLVDVTWDDRENGPVYTWFNIGEDRARLMHVWDGVMSVPLLEKTPLSGRPVNEYWLRDISEAGAAAADALENKYPSFTLVLPEGNGTKEEILDAVSKVVNRSFTYEWNEYMKTLRVIPGV